MRTVSHSDVSIQSSRQKYDHWKKSTTPVLIRAENIVSILKLLSKEGSKRMHSDTTATYVAPRPIFLLILQVRRAYYLCRDHLMLFCQLRAYHLRLLYPRCRCCCLRCSLHFKRTPVVYLSQFVL